MAYTPPAGNAANLNFGTGYSAPAGNAADLSFLAGYQASGFSSTQFGSTGASYSQFGAASGFVSVEFGTPTEVHDLVEQASGFSSTQFGTPFIDTVFPATGFLATQFGQPVVQTSAFGWLATQFGIGTIPLLVTGINNPVQLGSPAAYPNFPTYAIPPVAKFGLATITLNQSGEAYGFTSTGFGLPSKPVSASVTINSVNAAAALYATQFGTPALFRTTTVEATGVTVTVFGGASARLGQAASGLYAVQMGVPTGVCRGAAVGVSSTVFGTPLSGRSHAVTGIYRAVRWGVAGVSQSNTYKAYRINTPTRFGRPGATNRINRTATAIHTTQLGAHTSFETHHAWRVEPTTQLGQPLLIRTPLC